jgi:nucleoid-associated protein YgaU
VVSPETASAKEISPPESEGNSAVGERSPSPLVGQGILEESREKGSEEVTKSQQEVPVKEVPVREVAAVEVNAKDDNVSANEEVANNNSGSEKIYVVQKDETLMWVAYKLYGDYRKWRELVALNRDVLGNSSELSEGLKLKYNVTSGAVVTNARGEPYLINWGDTLAKISQKVYETTKRWKDIWKNNKSMIKNPNIIFAGFTLYYIPKSELMAKY